MNFIEKRLLKDNYYWTAEYHSFDQRHGDIYYVMTIYEKEGETFTPIKRYGTRFSEYSKGSQSETEFLLKELTASAKEGKTNIPSNIYWKGIGQDEIDQL